MIILIRKENEMIRIVFLAIRIKVPNNAHGMLYILYRHIGDSARPDPRYRILASFPFLNM